jgi:hypothetical protein
MLGFKFKTITKCPTMTHGLAGGIVQDRMGGSFGAGFLAGSVGSYFGSSGKSSKAKILMVYFP